MKRDKVNVHILRDLALLQIQLRDLPGHLRTRKAMLLLKQERTDSWLTFTLAWELVGNFDAAIDVLSTFEDISEGPEQRMKNGKPIPPSFEAGERKLYLTTLYQQAGRFEEAIKYLDTNAPRIPDKHGLKVLRAHLLLQSGDREGARTLYRQLIRTNPEDLDFHKGLQLTYNIGEGEPRWDGRHLDQLSEEQVVTLTTLYNELREEQGGCDALKTIPLRFLPPGTAFARQLESYLQPALRKGIPSLFATLEYLYEVSPAKSKIIGSTIESYEASLKATGRFPGREEEELAEPATTLLWAMLFLAQHLSKVGEFEAALARISEAEAHTPTVVDIYAMRASILQRAGAFGEAADAMEQCREMDLADRYLNTLSTQFLLRADRVEQANSVVELFIKDAEGATTSLAEMQCIWYQQQAGESFLRTGKLGQALQRGLSIASHFDDFIEDQFDFHMYCMRKVTLRAYRDLLRFEDKVRSHNNYFNAAVLLVKAYLALHDRPLQEAREQAEMFKGLEGAELQKAKKKLIKVQKKEALKAQEATKKAPPPKKKSVDEKTDLPTPQQLEETANPLDEAIKWAKSLELYCGDRIESHILAFEAFFLKGRFLLAIRPLLKAFAMNPSHPDVHFGIVRLASVNPEDVDEALREVFTIQRQQLTGGQTPQQLNEAKAQQPEATQDQLTQFAILQAEAFLAGEDLEALSKIRERVQLLPTATREEAEAVYQKLPFVFIKATREIFRQQAEVRFPKASAFAPTDAEVPKCE